MALLNNQMVHEIYPYDDIPNMMGKKKHVPNHQSD